MNAADLQIDEVFYHDVQHALSSAFGAYANDSDLQSPSTFNASRTPDWEGRPPPSLTPGLSAQDRQVQCIFTIRTALEGLSEELADILVAYYLVPIGDNRTAHKEFLCRFVGNYWVAPRARGLDPWFLVDCTRGWVKHYHRLHPDAYWAERLGKSQVRIRQWRNGNRQRNEHGVLGILDDRLNAAHALAQENLKRAGLIRG